MGENLIKSYEISVWEDKLTQDGFIENKLAVIGSDTMTGYNKIYNPVFNKKSNGEKTLSFSLHYQYFDPYSENDKVVNPFAALLVNERKVKLYYDNKWYEFIIKDHTESSDGLEWTYTCTDAFVLELSKNGYNITFDSELNNNQGTARELAEETLKDTDWRLGSASVGRQMVAEPVYKATLISTSGITIENTDNTQETVSAGTTIYLFYSYIKNENGKFVQFIIRDNTRKYTIDDNNVITDTNFRIQNELEYKNDGFYWRNNKIISWGEPETQYQANRLVYGQLTTYDPVMERTVDIFKVDDREIYKYTDYIYTTSNVVMNYITNGNNFNALEDGTLQGWNPYVETENNAAVNKLELVTRPELGTGIELADVSLLSQIEGFLKIQPNGALTAEYQNAVYNSGIDNNASFIESISKGDKFVFRWRAGKRNPNEQDENKRDVDCLIPYQNLRIVIAKYTQDEPTRYGYYYKHIDKNNIIMEFTGEPVILNNIIDGGELIAQQDHADQFDYVIDNVVQTPSTKYVYISNNQEYIWDGLAGKFREKTNDNYIPYYYLIAEAQKPITNADLKDVTQKFGIFVYTTDAPTAVYVQDIQLTRFIPNGKTNQPILIGNVPTATSISTDYYYLKPSEDMVAEDVITYTHLPDLASDLQVQSKDIYPIYNVNSEKVLSISVSKSNCFNILQTIAETFECWVELVVDHDVSGYITYDENNKPNKYVYLKEYVGKDNWAGFKYGINLQSIERTVNSDEIVTKLIVDLSQSEYVDEGYVSIANAKSNQSGESYILNFDYYYNQGLLNREEVEKDRIKFSKDTAKLNGLLQEQEKLRRDLETSLTALGSKRNTYTELVNTAKENQSAALAEFEELTEQSYEDYKQEHTSIPEDSQLTKEDTIFDVLGKLYANSATINNYSGILTNIEQEYWKVRKKLRGSENYSVKIWTGEDDNQQRHVYVELNDFLPGFSFTLGDSSPYESTVSKKYFDIESNSHNIVLTVPAGYTIESDQYEIIDNKVEKIKIINDETIEGVEDVIKSIQEEKDLVIKEFNNKYSRFIQEGTWNSTDYIDSELYYLDALQVSNTSAQPTVSYTINVVEVSEFEGLEWYLFDAGDKTYIEDTEFFGWSNVGGVLTPAREEVIVSEVEWHLDEPDQNVITVQNYKTRFEDLFQRISAAVQTVQYNEATYAKISTLLDANGTINQNVLLNSLNNVSGQRYALTTDGSIIIDGNQITVRNLTNPANLVIINSEGIRISSDGGASWQTAIDGRGIRIDAVYTGTLNTDQVIIGSRDNPSFRWDKSGISAYKQNTDNGVYDLQTYVRYDQYGLYGIKQGGIFKAQTLQDVLDKAHFAVTWDGFFIKNSYPGGGRVEITSENDFRVLKKDSNDEEREVIKIGALEWNGSPIRPVDSSIPPSLYGIRITNDDGIDTFKTGTDGNIEITGVINATGGNFNTIVNVGPEDANHIIIDGTDGPNSPSISSSNYNDGASTGWIINKDGDAVFNNITARGAIKTAVFEYAEIQAVGGIFIFRPSSVIKSARISDDDSDLIVTVEKPLLFKKISYNQISNPASGSNPKTLGWYEKPAYGGYKLTDDTAVNSEKEYYVRVETANGSWCKISNYIADGTIADATIHNILRTNGLTHVYEVSDINSDGEITLAGAKAFVTAVKQPGQSDQDVLNALVGGALIDMGRTDGSSNYGIGINSSDNTVNLPARAISLFETTINTNSTNNLKVGYDIRGILGTLPILEYTGDKPKVNEIYHNNLEGTQGIYTDNMYIGNHDQYITFYSSKEDGSKHLKINAQEFTLKAGAFNGRAVDGRQNFVYLSNEDYAKDIVNGIQINNSNVKADWRLIIGNKFGVDKAGNLYAANAHIEGDIQATSGHFGSVSYDGNTTTIPENAITGLTEKLNQISNEASLKGYTLHVESIYPDYPSEIIDGTPDNITLIAHVYYANRDITTSCDPNLFIWQLKNEEQIETLTPNIDNPYSVTYDRNLAGYGTTIICNFAIDEEVLLTTPDHFALETPDGYLLTARV